MDPTSPVPKLRWRPPYEAALLVLFVLGTYFTRIADPPLVGEEPRWACGAEEMLRTGDWIVPRQQGRVFPERPPLGSWAMAAVALVRGTGVDVVAIRLPSLVAVLFTCLIIYAYGRQFLSRWGALAAGLVYASFGHVLQIGRLGESDTLFTLFAGGAILVWHWGHSRRWPGLAVWCVGYGLAALGALVKGPQAPAYFVAATGAYLVLRREWAYLINWRHAAGLGVFALVVGAWQVPFYLATDWAAVQAVWGGLAGDRFKAGSLLGHVVTYPAELLVCGLPWSPLLLAFIYPRFRASLGEARPMVVFLVTAILVTLPTVLLAAAARGRYYMPMFPCFAVLVGVVIERVVTMQRATIEALGWRVFLRILAVCSVGTGTIALTASFSSLAYLNVYDQPPWFAVLFFLCGIATALAMLWSAGLPYFRSRGADFGSMTRGSISRVAIGAFAVAIFAAILRVGFVTNIETALNNPLDDRVQAARELIPEPDKLVSLGPVDHRFVYFYRQSVPELDWPERAEDLPAGVTYFCLNRFPEDTAEIRADGRGRSWRKVPGTLPFEWEEMTQIPVNRRYKPGPQPVVVIGKVIRPTSASASEASPAEQAPPAQAARPTSRRRSS